MAKKMYEETRIAAIAEKIRELLGSDERYTTGTMPLGVEEVAITCYLAGRAEGGGGEGGGGGTIVVSVSDVIKSYPSVEEMNANFATDGVPVGKCVIIDTGNVEDEENAQLYIKTETEYMYLADLSGAQGIQGIQGVRGEQGPEGPAYTLTDSDKETIAAAVKDSLTGEGIPSHNHSAETITAGTFAGQVKANDSYQDTNTSLLRNSRILPITSQEVPTQTGETYWYYS